MLSSIFEKASNLSESFQAVADRVESGKVGASKVHDDLAAKIGTKRQIKTPQGTREVVEICLLGETENVTKVRCLASDKEFALKRMSLGNEKGDKEVDKNASAMVSLEALQQMVDKAENLPKLGAHPNIAKCVSSQPDNTNRSHGFVFLMELCDESVTSIVKSKGPMSAEEVLKMLKDVVAGLEFLHGQKEGPVIHGSVYASHVLKGKGGEWKLASFGKTTFDGESEDSAVVKLDIWQLGALIFVALFGAHPFGRASEGSKAAMSLKEGCALKVPHQRPRTLLEGKLCILMHWLLAPDAALRPTSKQVGVVLSHLDNMVATQLMKAVPPPVRKLVAQTFICAELKTLAEGFSSSCKDPQTSEISKDLVMQYGENVMLNPKLIPEKKLQEVLPRSVFSRIKELYTFYGIPEGTLSNVKVVAPKKSDDSQTSEVTSKPQDAVSTSKAPAPQPQSQDLLDMGGGKEEVKEKAKAKPPQDLLDMGDSQEPAQEVKKEPAASLDLLDFGEPQAVVPQVQAESQQCDMLGDLLNMGSAPEAQPQVQTMPGDLFDLGSAPQPQAQSMPADLFDLGSAPAPVCQGNSFDAGYFQQTSPTPMMFPQASNVPQTSSVAPANPFAPSASAMMPPVMPNVAPGNPFEASNPFGASNASQSQPAAVSNDDAFAFAVSNLATEMKSGK